MGGHVPSPNSQHHEVTCQVSGNKIQFMNFLKNYDDENHGLYFPILKNLRYSKTPLDDCKILITELVEKLPNDGNKCSDFVLRMCE